MVFAADLEQVEEVGSRGMDGDEVFVRLGCRCRKIEDFEDFWTLCIIRTRYLTLEEHDPYRYVLLDLYSFHLEEFGMGN